MRQFVTLFILSAAALVGTPGLALAATQRELTFGDRVAAQKAIEQVYWNHRVWPSENPSPKPSLADVLSEAAIAERVKGYLVASNALEALWHHPITVQQLQNEMNRMAGSTRDPTMLHELFDALGNDPFVIAETLARATLAESLVRGEFTRVTQEGTNFESWWAQTRGTLQPSIDLPRGTYELPTVATVNTLPMAVPAARQGHTVVWTGDSMIIWGGESLTNTGAIYAPTIDQWFTTSTGADVPSGRGRHTAIWTGAEMIVWGGLTASGETNTGGRYDLATDSWSATSTGLDVPSARQRHTAVWTGSRMIVFGGSAGSTYYDTGASYDPGNDSWTAISTGTGVPSIREQHTAVWTGTQMIVWGGNDSVGRLNTGSRYTPSTNTWSATATTAAPTARNRHTAIWTGSQMVIWGGFGTNYLNTGGRYNPSINAWTATAGGPTGRAGHTAVWTGTEMIMWGGQGLAGALDTGSRYNFAANTWTAIASGGGSPAGRYGHTAIWDGAELVVWGGTNGTTALETGGRYAGYTTSWRSTATAAPAISSQPRPQTAVIGGGAELAVIATGNDTLAYRWRRNGVELDDGPRIAGSTTSVLSLSGVSSGDAGDYSVAVTNDMGTATSADAALAVVAPRAGDVDPFFERASPLDYGPSTVVVQPDGKAIIGGAFTAVPGAARSGLARLNADGTVDRAFMSGLLGADDRVEQIKVQGDGKILVVGNFTLMNGVARGRIARLNPDGTVDTGFMNGMAGANDWVLTVAPLPDGKVLVGGWFGSMNGASGWNGIARLNSDGSNDNTFHHGPGSGPGSKPLRAIAVQPDGKIVVVGTFATINGDPRRYIARLNADGTTDLTFGNGMAGANYTIYSVEIQTDGRILVGGEFDTINDVARPNLARLNVDGSLDTSFLAGLTGPNGWVGELIQLSGGRLLISGGFTSINGVPRSGIAKLNVDGSVDDSFQSGMSGADGVVAEALGSDGRIVIAGTFTQVNGVARNGIARLNADGSLDPSYDLTPSGIVGPVYAFLTQSDGRVIVGGDFTAVDGIDRRALARLIAGGSLDPTLPDLSFDGPVDTIVRQPDGRILVGGSFTRIGGTARRSVARLNPDGTLDESFVDPAVTGLYDWDHSIADLLLQPDGRIVIVGTFKSVGGLPRGNVARLNPDGTLDTTFGAGMSGADDTVAAVAPQAAGRIVIAGGFRRVHGTIKWGVARLEADGSLDPAFALVRAETPYFLYVYALAIQADGKIVIGGFWDHGDNGTWPAGIARLMPTDGSRDSSFMAGLPGAYDNGGPYGTVNTVRLDAEGRILAGGEFRWMNGARRDRIARLLSDGALDTSFQDGMSGANDSVNVIDLRPDGRLLIGGGFGSVNGIPRGAVAQLYGEAPVAPAISAQPADQVSYAGSCAVFHVAATGTPLDFRWRHGGVDLADGPNVSGSATATLTLTGVSAPQLGDYDCVVTNVLGEATTTSASLSLVSIPECKGATCDPVLGSVLIDAADGTACNDGNACTAGDACGGGVCAPGAPVPPPGEVASVQVEGHTTSTLTWLDLGGGALYDVASATLTDLRSTGIVGATCLANDVLGASYMDTQPSPTAGNGYYYIVRGQTACGDGGYGTSSAGVPRTPTTACP